MMRGLPRCGSPIGVAIAPEYKGNHACRIGAVERQRLLDLIAAVVPLRLRQAVPHAIKEPVVNLFSRPPAAPLQAAPEPHALERPHLPRAEFDAIWQEAFGSRTDAARGYF